MKFLPILGSLNSILGGTLGAGTVPLDRFLRYNSRDTNTGVITLSTMTPTTIASLSGLAVKDGDLVICYGMVQATKGGVAGDISLVITGGGANIEYYVALGTQALGYFYNLAAGTVFSKGILGIHKVTADHTLGLTFRGTSPGSTSSVAIGAGSLQVVVIANSEI